jgi:hypothetical protein
MLANAGAGTVFAASLALADQVLITYGFPRDDAARVITAIRAKLNPDSSDALGSDASRRFVAPVPIDGACHVGRDCKSAALSRACWRMPQTRKLVHVGSHTR